MTNMSIQARNVLPRNAPTTLVVVRVNPHGKPDSVSWWACQGNPKTENAPYSSGALVDILV